MLKETGAPDAPTQTAFDEIIGKLYAAVSGPAGPPDWRHEREIFHEAARLMRIVPDEAGGTTLKIMSVDQYIEDVTPFLTENDFYETETARHTEVFGAMATIQSAYEYRFAPDGPAARRGVNSIQLYCARGRWRIVSMLWDNAR